MKTTVPFNKKSLKATIIVPASEEQKFRTLFTSDGISITKEHLTRGDDKHTFVLKDLDIPAINLLLVLDEVRVHYYELLLNTGLVKACFRMENNKVEIIELSFKDGQNDKGEDKWRGTVTIYGSKKDCLDKEYEKYEVNWAAIGSVSPETARNFESTIHTACVLAEELNAQIK